MISLEEDVLLQCVCVLLQDRSVYKNCSSDCVVQVLEDGKSVRNPSGTMLRSQRAGASAVIMLRRQVLVVSLRKLIKKYRMKNQILFEQTDPPLPPLARLGFYSKSRIE